MTGFFLLVSQLPIHRFHHFLKILRLFSKAMSAVAETSKFVSSLLLMALRLRFQVKNLHQSNDILVGKGLVVGLGPAAFTNPLKRLQASRNTMLWLAHMAIPPDSLFPL